MDEMEYFNFELGADPAAARAQIEKMEKKARVYKMPDFEKGWDWLNSGPLSLADSLKGKVVLLDFWTYCCINCIHIIPDMHALEKKFGNGGNVVFIGVHSAKFDQEKDSENIRNAVLRYEIDHPVVNDAEMVLWNKISVMGWPSLVVVSPRGTCLLMVSGEGKREIIDVFLQECLKFYKDELVSKQLKYDPERNKMNSKSPLRFPGKLAVLKDGVRVAISDSNNNRIVIIDSKTKACVGVIGSGKLGFKDGSFSKATFNRPQGIVAIGDTLYVADTENHAIRACDLGRSTVVTVAGTGQQGSENENSGPGTSVKLSSPWDVATRGDGKLYIANSGTHQLWTLTLSSGTVDLFSGTGEELNRNGDDVAKVAWAQPSGLAFSPDGKQLYVADSESSTVRGVVWPDAAGAAPSVRPFVGGDKRDPKNLFAYGDRDGKSDLARLQHPLGVVYVQAKQRVAIADTYNHKIKLMDPSVERAPVATWLGTGKAGLKDGAPAEAQFNEPSGFAVLPSQGVLLVADTNNHVIRSVAIESGVVSTLQLTAVPAAGRSGSSSRRRGSRRGSSRGERDKAAAAAAAAAAASAPVEMKRLTNDGNKRVKRFTTRAQKISANATSRIEIELRLPFKTHWTSDAPSRVQVILSEGSPIRFAENPDKPWSLHTLEEHHVQAKGQLMIPITIGDLEKSQKTSITIESTTYFCLDDGGLCVMDAVCATVPLVASSGKSQAIRLAHKFVAPKI